MRTDISVGARIPETVTPEIGGNTDGMKVRAIEEVIVTSRSDIMIIIAEIIEREESTTEIFLTAIAIMTTTTILLADTADRDRLHEAVRGLLHVLGQDPGLMIVVVMVAIVGMTLSTTGVIILADTNHVIETEIMMTIMSHPITIAGHSIDMREANIATETEKIITIIVNPAAVSLMSETIQASITIETNAFQTRRMKTVLLMTK